MTLTIGALAPAQNEPPFVRLMIRALNTLRCSGTAEVTIMQNGGRVTSTEYHLRDGSKVRTWYPEDSPNHGEVIVDDGKIARHYFPRGNRILISDSPYGEGRERVIAAVRQKRFKLSDGGTVAGRATQLLTILDAGGRPLQGIWADTQTGGVLKRVMYDAVGAVQASTEYTEYKLNPKIVAGDFEIRAPGAKKITLYELAADMAKDAGLPAITIPQKAPGVRLINVRKLMQRGGQIIHQTYRSPRGPVSFFYTNGTFARPATPPGVSVVQWKKADLRMALVGRVPRPFLEDLSRQLGNQ